MKEPTRKIFIGILVYLFVWLFSQSILALEVESINRYCVTRSYPQIVSEGHTLKLDTGEEINLGQINGERDHLNGSLNDSLEQIYPLEPSRPESEEGFNPGRVRPYGFYELVYGKDQQAVKSNLVPVKFLGKSFPLAANVAKEFQKLVPDLEKLAMEHQELKKFLKPEGGYYWRKIAGEKHLSAHSYGIALDIGVDASPYWRWNRQMPHPLQKTYPEKIVRLFEEHGFIWGGKWRNYDIMHFEYRPELVCKARMKQLVTQPFTQPLPFSK